MASDKRAKCHLLSGLGDVYPIAQFQGRVTTVITQVYLRDSVDLVPERNKGITIKRVVISAGGGSHLQFVKNATSGEHTKGELDQTFQAEVDPKCFNLGPCIGSVLSTNLCAKRCTH